MNGDLVKNFNFILDCVGCLRDEVADSSQKAYEILPSGYCGSFGLSSRDKRGWPLSRRGKVALFAEQNHIGQGFADGNLFCFGSTFLT